MRATVNELWASVLAIALGGSTGVVAQNTLQYQWDNSLSGLSNEFVSKLIATADGGFLIAGSSNSDSGVDVTQPNFDQSGPFPTSDIWLVKCDADGNVQWDGRYGTSDDDNFGDVVQTTDGGYLLHIGVRELADGNLTEPGFGSSDLYVLKLNATGGIVWHRRLGGSEADAPGDILQTDDGGYLIGGYTSSSGTGTITATGHGDWDYFITKLTNNGVQEWSRLIGGPGGDYLVGITATDGGYILAGSSLSNVGGDKNVPNHEAGELDMWIVKVDDLGNVVDQRIVGSLEADMMTGYTGFTDGGIILATSIWAGIGGDKTEGTWGAIDGWIIRLDADLNIVWDHSVGGDVHEDDFGNLSLSNDGNIIASGTSYSTINTGWKGEDNIGPENTWVVLIDPEGNKIWDKTVLTGYAHSETGHAVQLLDGCYVVADNGDALLGNEKTEQSLSFDYWTVKYCELASAPVADFNVEIATGCTSALVDFVNRSTNASSWTWLIEGATVADPDQQFLTDVVFDQEGTYTVTLIACNAELCDTLTQRITITFGNTLLVDIGDLVVLCSDDDFVIDTEIVGATYAWSLNGSPLPQATSAIVADEPGLYSVIVTNAMGCVGTDSVQLVNVVESVDLGPDTALCAGAEIVIQSNVDTGAFQWFLNEQAVGGNTPELLADQPGSYVLVHTYACGTNADTLVIREETALVAPLLSDTVSLCDVDPYIVVVDDAGAILWSTGHTGSTLSITAAGNYSVSITNACGSVSASFVVDPCGSPNRCTLSMPNVFTPNGDGLNEVATPDPDRTCTSPIELVIFDRWGLQLFQQRSVHPVWDGRSQRTGTITSDLAPAGVYYYICQANDGEVLKGHLTLVR